MGATHSICQDYAAALQKDGKAVAVLSDGCSGIAKNDPGSPHTDFGSRFLVRSTLHHLQDLFDGVLPEQKIAVEADGMIRQTRLSRTALDATLLAAVKNGRYTRTFQIGDGVIAGRSRDGGLRYYTLSFGGNHPYYLSYTLDPSREDQFFENAKTVTLTTNRYTPGEGWGIAVERTEALEDFKRCQQHLFSHEEYDMVLLMSDGVQSFMQKRTTSSIPLEQVLEQVLAVKNFQGEFLTRRCNAFLTRFCVENGWVHNDDFSCTGIYHGPLSQ
jgi:hypothetical protein